MKDPKNLVILICRLGQDPEFIPGSEEAKNVCRFSAATTQKYTNKRGEKVEKTQWHKCVIFGKRAEVFKKYVSKGNQVQVVGSLNYQDYTDKENIKRMFTSIIVDDFVFLEKRKVDEGTQDSNQDNKADVDKPEPVEASADVTEDNLPF